MCLFSKVKDLREKLLQNCKYAIDRLEAAEKRVIYYSSSNQEDATTSSYDPNKPADNTTTDPSGTKKSESDISYEISDREIMNSFMSLTHGVLIQEWELFLYDICAEGFIYYLSLGDPKYQLRLENLKPTFEVADIRTHISEEVKESFRGYKKLFKITCELFRPTVPEPLKYEMQKQMQIRHIFHHNRGIIRNQDLIDIGKQSIEILDDKGNPRPDEEGKESKESKEISLSLPEIHMLYDTIEKYSEKFQIKAEMAQPVKATNSSVKKPEVNT